MNHFLNRRSFITGLTATVGSSALTMANPSSTSFLAESQPTAFQLKPKYILGSCMYGYSKLTEILPEVPKIGATAIDIWPKVHGDQREQLDALGEEKFKELINENGVSLGCLTQYKLGPFRLKDEMKLANRLGCKTIVTGGSGPKNLTGNELKSAVRKFAERMRPHLEIAKANDVTIAIENHGNNLIQSPDSMKWLIEFAPENLGIALAPYHLPQEAQSLAKLIGELGNRISMFYAWQYGMGCTKKLPKEQELLQMPGRGKLDFKPLVEALAKIKYDGWFEIFMHPVPRGVPILDSTDKVTAEINKSRDYISRCIESTPN